MSYINYIEQESSIKALKELEKKGYDVNLDEIYKTKAVIALEAIRNQEFQDVYKSMPRILNRKQVFEAYREDLYKGFVYSMLWGGIGSYSMNQATTAFSISKSIIVEKLKKVKALLNDDKIREAFDSMNTGNNKIDQIDVSYFTKIMYFLYQGNEELRPLIYDKWGKFIHAGLIIDNRNYLEARETYNMGYNKDGFYVKERNRKTRLCSIYMDYIKMMSVESKKLKLTNSGILEEFLFGKNLKMRDNKNDSNPRYFLKNYIIQKYKENKSSDKDEIKEKKGKKNTNTNRQANNNQQHQEQPTNINYQPDYEALVRRNTRYRVFDDSERIKGRTVYYGCELDNGLKLYVGRNKKSIFCSIIGNNLTQEIKDSYSALLPKSGRDWIARYCEYNEAVVIFNEVLDRLSD